MLSSRPGQKKVLQKKCTVALNTVAAKRKYALSIILDGLLAGNMEDSARGAGEEEEGATRGRRLSSSHFSGFRKLYLALLTITLPIPVSNKERKIPARKV